MTTHKNKFKTYTNVSRHGNNILFLGYDHDGNPVKEKIRFEPSMFLEHQEGEWKTLTGTNVKEKKFSTMADASQYVKDYKDVYKIYGCSDYVRQFIGTSFRGDMVAEKDLVQVNFFDIETKVGEAVDENGNKLGEGFPQPETAYEEITLISLYNRTKTKMITWGLYEVDDPRFNSKSSLEEIELAKQYIKENKIDYRCFHEDEKAMLSDFIKYINSVRIDILSGWNSEFFDVPYLYNRIKRVFGENVASLLSPWKIVEENKRFVMNKERSTYDIGGIACLDLLDLYKKFNPGSKEEFNLAFIAELELGETKIENPGDDFKDFYQNYWATFVLYNIRDVELLDKLDKKKEIIDLCMSVAYMAKCNFIDVISAMRTWESIIYNYFLDLHIAEDWNKKTSKKDELEGAYVHAPIPGSYKRVVSIDATALYPSFIMQNNLSPETIVGKIEYTPEDFLNGYTPHLEKNQIISCNGLITRSDKDGFINILTKRVFDGRTQAKNEMLELKKIVKSIEDKIEKSSVEQRISALNMKQGVLKVLGNSLYGVCSMAYFRYYNHYIAEAITLSGQSYLKLTMRILNELINTVCKTTDVEYAFYGDTDSIFFTMEKFVDQTCVGKTEKEITAYLEKFVKNVVQPHISKRLNEVSSKMGAPESRIFFKLEGISRSAIWLAKKRYVCALDYNEGVWYDPPEMKIMGMEIVRSSTPKLIKGLLRESVDICINQPESKLHTFISKCKKEFVSRPVDEISFPRGCNGIDVYSDDDTIYKSGTPIHVRGALMHNHMVRKLDLTGKIRPISNGERIKFVYLKMPNPTHEDVIGFVGKMPPEFGLEKYIDKNKMFEKGFIGPIEGVLDAIGWTSEEQITIDL